MSEPEADEVKVDCEGSEAMLNPSLPQDPGKAQPPIGTTVAIKPAISAEPIGEVKNNRTRKDRGRLHAVRHGALARYPLEALRHLGEDGKALRRLEQRFRAELKPRGIIADLLFDRFWSAYLRCLLAARVEAGAFLAAEQNPGQAKGRVPALIQADQPTLVIDDEQISVAQQTLAPDVLHQLLLVQRYDRHFSREMYQALALLLVMRASGEQGLEQSIAKMFGVAKEG